MLEISERQWQLFSADAESRSNGELAQYFRRELPARCAQLDDAELVGSIRQLRNRARSYGADQGDALIRFIALALIVHPRFDEEPAIQRFLLLSQGSPADKLTMLTKGAATALARIDGGH